MDEIDVDEIIDRFGLNVEVEDRTCGNCLNWDIDECQCDLFEEIDGERVHEKHYKNDIACLDWMYAEDREDSLEKVLNDLFQEIEYKFDPHEYNLSFLEKYLVRLHRFGIEIGEDD